MFMCILRFIRSLDVIRNATREFPLSRVLSVYSAGVLYTADTVVVIIRWR